ncbi:MAG: hypothetical protein HPY58_12285 [Firmicutes bacterium]|nr:hypothetical protein [Bacillota bacterium]
MISYTVQHILILRLLMCYTFESARSLHNLLFLVSAEKTERQQLGFYDFVRTRTGAHSRIVQRILEDLKKEKLFEGPGLRITDKGRAIYANLGASLNPFSSFWNLCIDIVERYGGNPENLNKAVFYHLAFRRAKIGERILLP